MRSHFVAAGLSLLFAVSTFAQGSGAEARLREKHIVLPPAPTPVGMYVGAVRTGNLLFLSGTGGDEKWRGKGKVGRDISADDAREAAHSAGLRMLAAARQELGSLDKVKRVVKILGLVNAAPGFIDSPRVIDGFSAAMIDAFGDVSGKGARTAIGVAELPFNMPVEIEMVLEIEPGE